MTQLWNVEINVLNIKAKKSEWRKVGENILWKKALEIRRKYRPYLTRSVRANNSIEKICPTCGALGGHWLSCASANSALALGRSSLIPVDAERAYNSAS